MKNYHIIWIVFLTFVLASCSSQRSVPTSFTSDEVINAVDNQSIQFDSRLVHPARGRQLTITGNYFLKITNDTITADLPYFGRAYTATLGGEGGIKFESTDFDYVVTPTKKGGRQVTIHVRNSNVVNQLVLTVSGSGSADLRVTPTNRQFISYTGEVKPL